MIDHKNLEIMEFKKSGLLKLTPNGQFEFDAQDSSKNIAPGVYLWLRRKDPQKLDVMYAGKAGNGISIRMSQHIAGLKLAPAVRVERIKATFGEGDCLEVWFRQSASLSLGTLFSEEISAYSTEEEALITRFSPQLNRAKTPAMRTQLQRAAKPQGENTAFKALSFEMSSANGRQRDLWEDAATGLTESHKQKIGKILTLLENLEVLREQWPKLDCKIVGSYTAGPIRNQSVIVFGELAKTNFRPGSRVVYVSLEKELIAFSPEVTERMRTPPDVDGAYSLDASLKMLTR